MLFLQKPCPKETREGHRPSRVVYILCHCEERSDVAIPHKLSCHCEERSDVAISIFSRCAAGPSRRPLPTVFKNGKISKKKLDKSNCFWYSMVAVSVC